MDKSINKTSNSFGDSFHDSTNPDNKSTNVPIARIRTIMKSSPDIGKLSVEAVFLMARSTELFIQYIAKEACAKGREKDNFDYKTISDLVSKDPQLNFLETILPPKITVKKYKEIMAEISSSEDSVTSSSSDDEVD